MLNARVRRRLRGVWVYSEVTGDIRVSVKPTYLEGESDPLNHVFTFAYKISIENCSAEAVQLLERHWIVISGDEHLAEVVGPGVMGQLPVIGSGARFEYMSEAVIDNPCGSMHGSYTFRTENGRFLTVPIPRFELFSSLITIH